MAGASEGSTTAEKFPVVALEARKVEVMAGRAAEVRSSTWVWPEFVHLAAVAGAAGG